MAYDVEDRVAVVVTPTTMGVTVTLGEVQVTVRSPLPPGSSQMTEQQARAGALRAARRALEVALEELHQNGDNGCTTG